MMRVHRFFLLAVAFLAIAPVKAGPPMRLSEFSGADNMGWAVINDDVMGGRSSSTIRFVDGNIVFRGELNTNGGGFVSFRTAQQTWDLSDRVLVKVRVRGDGRRYQLRLHTKTTGIAYKSQFQTHANRWQVVAAQISTFKATRRGREQAMPPPRPEDIVGFGLLLADAKDGPFQVELDWVEFTKQR
tara:strand:- start:42 stop:599 length:558 start_codon:yes stop_codon:yes gene_type:complete